MKAQKKKAKLRFLAFDERDFWLQEKEESNQYRTRLV